MCIAPLFARQFFSFNSSNSPWLQWAFLKSRMSPEFAQTHSRTFICGSTTTHTAPRSLQFL